MKKLIQVLLAGLLVVSMISACGGSSTVTPTEPAATEPAATTAAASAADATTAAADGSSAAAATTSDAAGTAGQEGDGEEIVDGRFKEARSIRVQVMERNNDGGTPPEDNVWAQFIKDGVKEAHNIDVTYQLVPRFSEIEVMNNLLAAGDAPDIGITYSYATIITYANMGGIIDLAPLVASNQDKIQNLIKQITEPHLYYRMTPTGELWAMQGYQFNSVGQRTFIREDWLAKLNMDKPTDINEFETMLYAFKDNAELLLGEDASRIVPFLISSNTGWSMIDMQTAFVPGDITEKDLFVYGYDARITYPGTVDAVRKFNEWYNAGLCWNDFPLYDSTDSYIDNMHKAGYVGSFQGNVDIPYRNGNDGTQYNMQMQVGPEAAYTVAATFKNDRGLYQKYENMPIHCAIYMPTTNKEPLASLMYLDYIARDEVRTYLQIGEEGIGHEILADGTIKLLAGTGEWIHNSLYNLDYTLQCNGLNLYGDQELTTRAIAESYPGIDRKYIIAAYDMSPYSVMKIGNPQTAVIKSEEGMATMLEEKRDNLFIQAVVAPVSQFDAVWEAGWADYLASGGQAIIDERLEAWEAIHGDKTSLN